VGGVARSVMRIDLPKLEHGQKNSSRCPFSAALSCSASHASVNRGYQQEIGPVCASTGSISSIQKPLS
jgi:hypothetical protein